MPSTKPSTSSRYCKACVSVAGKSHTCGLFDADYKLLLEELLAEIHRDGGQFTKLAGLMTSLQEAHKIVIEQRCKITRLLTTTRTR